MKALPQKIIDYFEKQKAPLINYFIAFMCLIQLRNFFECFTHGMFYDLFTMQATFFLAEICHFTLCYVFVAILFALIVFYATKESVGTIFKVILPGFMLTVLVPLVDLVVSKGVGRHIYYLIPNNSHSLWYYFFSFFGDYYGISFGMRLEVVMAMIFSFCYFRVKEQGFFWSVFCMFLIYTAIFTALAAPYAVSPFFSLLHLPLEVAPHVMVNFFLLIMFPLGAWLAYLANKKIFLEIIKDLRLLRLLHFEAMLFLGVALASKIFTIQVIPQLLLLNIAILFFWLFSVMTNNIADQAIDRVCNQDRPLIKQTIAIKVYQNIALCFLLLSLIYALAVNLRAFLFILGVNVAYAMYSLPPLRCKRIPLFSKLIIAGISLALVLLGFYITARGLRLFPQAFAWVLLLGFTLALNIIDIKDYAGDRAAHIKTLPVLLGEPTSKFFIGIACIIANALFCFYFAQFAYMPGLILFGSLEFYFINKKPYQEWKVIAIYLLNILALIILVLMAAKLS